MAEKLAIYQDLPTIIEIIQKNTVSSIIAPTGSGKSIGVLWALIREGKRVMCTQPTIPAATSLFEYQKKLSPRFKIGFAAEGNINYTKDTDCVYCTAGHLRKVMKGHFKEGKAFKMIFADVLIVDEIHIGSRDNSIIIDLWIEAYKQGVEVPKLVLATATEFGCHELMQKLAELTNKNGKEQKPAVFRSTFRHFPVEVRYQMRDFEEPDSDESFVNAARIAVDLLVEKRGHGIVFCSGSSEVEDVVFELNELLDSRRIRNTFNKPIKVIGCYGQSKREEIDEAICDENDKPDDQRVIKIVVTTNLCESSLTVPDVIFIVDMLSEKRSDLVNDRFHLGTTWISKNSADQRKGRTGRTLTGGVCYRMCTGEFYQNLESFRPLEITRTPISDIVIEFMSCGLDPVKVISDLDPIKLIEAKKTLEETGCISVPEHKTEKELHDEMYPPLGGYKPKPPKPPVITHMGYFVAEMPMDVRNASAMFNYLNESTEQNNFWAIVAFVMVDIYGPSLFYFPRREKNENPKRYRARIEMYSQEHFGKFIGSHPIESLCNAFYDCLETLSSENEERHGSPPKDRFPRTALDAPFWKLRNWALENSCNNKKLREIVAQVKRIQKMLQSYIFPGIPKTSAKPAIPGGKKACEYIAGAKNPISNIRTGITKAFTSTYKSKILTPIGYDYISPDGHRVKVDTMKTVSRSSPGSKVLPLSEIHIKNRDSEQIMISLWMDAWVDPEEEMRKFSETNHFTTTVFGDELNTLVRRYPF